MRLIRNACPFVHCVLDHLGWWRDTFPNPICLSRQERTCTLTVDRAAPSTDRQMISTTTFISSVPQHNKSCCVTSAVIFPRKSISEKKSSLGLFRCIYGIWQLTTIVKRRQKSNRAPPLFPLLPVHVFHPLYSTSTVETLTYTRTHTHTRLFLVWLGNTATG